MTIHKGKHEELKYYFKVKIKIKNQIKKVETFRVILYPFVISDFWTNDS